MEKEMNIYQKNNMYLMNLLQEVYETHSNFKRYNKVLECNTFDKTIIVDMRCRSRSEPVIIFSKVHSGIDDVELKSEKLKKLIEIVAGFTFNRMVTDNESFDLHFFDGNDGNIGVNISCYGRRDVKNRITEDYHFCVNDNGYYRCTRSTSKKIDIDEYEVSLNKYQDDKDYFNDPKFPFGFEQSLKKVKPTFIYRYNTNDDSGEKYEDSFFKD